MVILDQFGFAGGVIVGITLVCFMVIMGYLSNYFFRYQVDDHPFYKDHLGYEVYRSKSKIQGRPDFYELRYQGFVVVRIPTNFYGEGFNERGVLRPHLQALLTDLKF